VKKFCRKKQDHDFKKVRGGKKRQSKKHEKEKEEERKKPKKASNHAWGRGGFNSKVQQKK